MHQKKKIWRFDISTFTQKLTMFLHFILVITFSCNIGWSLFILDLRKITQTEDFYQITLFTSSNTNKMTDFEIFSIHEFFRVTYSFHKDLRTIYNFYSKEVLNSMCAILESLVIFYTNNLNDVNPFIDLFKIQLLIVKKIDCVHIRQFHIQWRNSHNRYSEIRLENEVLGFYNLS